MTSSSSSSMSGPAAIVAAPAGIHYPVNGGPSIPQAALENAVRPTAPVLRDIQDLILSYVPNTQEEARFEAARTVIVATTNRLDNTIHTALLRSVGAMAPRCLSDRATIGDINRLRNSMTSPFSSWRIEGMAHDMRSSDRVTATRDASIAVLGQTASQALMEATIVNADARGICNCAALPLANRIC